MDGCTEKLDVFSHHYYNGVSERMEAMRPDSYVGEDGTLSEPYLGMAAFCARCFAPYRDKYVPGGEIWVTESGDAGAGGHTWASTYLEVPRLLDGKELTLGENDEMPELNGITASGKVEIAPGSCVFFVI